MSLDTPTIAIAPPNPPTTPLHYKSQGSGPLLILIPGGHGTSLLFTPVAQSLSSHFRVITYDRRGYHRSSHLPHPIPGSHAIQKHTDDLAQLIRYIQSNRDEQVTIFGSSWAAYIAINLFLCYPHLAGKVILHGPIYVSILPQATQETLRPKIFEMLRTFKEKGSGAANRLLMPLISSPPGDRAEFTQTSVYWDLTRLSTDFFAQWYEHEYADCLTFSLPLARLQLPGYKEKLVLMVGDEPAALPFPTDPAMIMARVLGTPVMRVPGGHMGYVTREGEFAEQMKEHIQRFTTAVILASVFGKRGEDFNSPNIQALYNVQNRFTAILERARAIGGDQRALYFRLYNETKERMARGVRTGCLMEKLIDEQGTGKGKSGMNDERTAYLGGILMAAGSGTTASTLLSFLQAMLENPAALRCAQEDVDGVCGVQRAPIMQDLEDLPYIEACMHEILRWRPVIAGGLPHMLMQADTGTIFFANAWAISRDENEYDEPEMFNPDRWLAGNKFGTKQNSGISSEHSHKTSYGWGAGRRICAGQKMAETSLKITIAKLVWAFDFEKEEGAGPLDVSMETGYTGRFLGCPKRFPIQSGRGVRSTPRLYGGSLKG
ncbi:cytochrome P450 [Aspergillus spectabilis]